MTLALVIGLGAWLVASSLALFFLWRDGREDRRRDREDATVELLESIPLPAGDQRWDYGWMRRD